MFAGLRASWKIRRRRAGWVGLLDAIMMLDFGWSDRVESSDVSICDVMVGYVCGVLLGGGKVDGGNQGI